VFLNVNVILNEVHEVGEIIYKFITNVTFIVFNYFNINQTLAISNYSECLTELLPHTYPCSVICLVIDKVAAA
jgi:hypothetical protein